MTPSALAFSLALAATQTAPAPAPPPRVAPQAAPAAWTQWGGPNQDFRAPAAGLASSWPEGGPPRLWSRALGEGYSAILFEDGRLYTMYRAGGKEAAVCLDAATGATIWEHAYEQKPHERHLSGYGDGPRSTPAIAGDQLFAIGVAGKLLALAKSDGRVLWTRELWADLDGSFLVHGYSSSPVVHDDSVIVAVGGDQGGLIAFNRKDGSVKWRSFAFKNSYSSPRIADVAGERQLLFFTPAELIGLDPDDGRLLWRFPHANQWGHNISMPAIAGDALFISSPQAGARGLQLTRDGETIEAGETWSTRKVQLYHVTSAQVGDWVYGSSGMMAPAFMSAVNIRTGEIGWRERGFAKADCVAADGKLLILDEDGMLYLTTATPEKLVVHANTRLFEDVAWTVPTIVGRTLYARDNRKIVALDLGAPGS